MAYPDTNLSNDQVDPDFGGQPASAFGIPAFQWLNSVLKFLANAYLKYMRAPYTTVVALSQGSGVAGDVMVYVAGTLATSGNYYVQRWTSGLANPVIVGIALESYSVAAKVRIATGGVVPSAITGIAPQSAAVDAGLDPGSGRVRVAQTGDTILGKIDVSGNTTFGAGGSPAP